MFLKIAALALTSAPMLAGCCGLFSGPPPEASTPGAKMNVHCDHSGTGVLCKAQASGGGQAKACWTTVATCGAQRHTANSCSPMIASGSTQEVNISQDFDPPLPSRGTCKLAVENVKMR